MDLKCWARRPCLAKGTTAFIPSAKEDCHPVGHPGGEEVGEKPPLSLASREGRGRNSPCPRLLQSLLGHCGHRSLGWEEEEPCRRRGLPPVLAQRLLLLSVSWQVKPVVSGFLREKQLPYNEDSYLARFRLFLNRYEEFMVQTPPITELVGLQ